MIQIVGRGLVVLGAGVLALSFGGGVHPLGDSLAVFRPVIMVAGLVACLLVFRWRIAQLVGLVMCMTGAWHWAGLRDAEVAYDFRTDFVIYQKNMLFRPTDRGPFIDDIRASGADVVTLQEVSRANEPVLEALRDAYPHQLLCNGHSVGAVAILSRTALSGTGCGTEPGFARAVTRVDGVPVQVISLHLFWPWPFSQAEQVAAILPTLSPMQGGVTVVGGDFNMVASSHTVTAIGRATETRRLGPLVETYDLMGYPLGIDHVLATGGTGTLSVHPFLGADHYGLVASVMWP